jgi:hypothetical protein
MNIRKAAQEYIVYCVAANCSPDIDAMILLVDFVGEFDVCYLSKQTINEWIASQYIRSSRLGIVNVDEIIHNFLEIKRFVYYLYVQRIVDCYPYKQTTSVKNSLFESVGNWKKLSASDVGRASSHLN